MCVCNAHGMENIMKQIIVADASKTNILKVKYELDKEFVIYPAKTEDWMLKVLRQKDIELLIIGEGIAQSVDPEDMVRRIRSNLKYRNLLVVYLTKAKINHVTHNDLVIKMPCEDGVILEEIKKFVKK